MDASPTELRQALETLFGPVKAVSRGFVGGLTVELLGQVFRRAAFLHHPDRALALGCPPEYLVAKLQRLNASYALLRQVMGEPGAMTRYADALTQRTAAVPPAIRARSPRATPTWKAPPAHRGPEPHPSASPPRSSATTPIDPPSGPCRLPGRHLCFAEFLYHSGRIDWQTIISALGWQARSRPRLGELAQQLGILSRVDLAALDASRRPGERFGEAALRHGVLTPFTLRVLLRRQTHLRPRIGRFFVEQGILGEESLDQVVDEQLAHNRRYASTG